MANTYCLRISRRQLICYKLLLFILLCGSYKILTNTHNPRAVRRGQKVTGWRMANTCRLLISRQQSICYKALSFTLSCGSYRLFPNTIHPRAVHRGQKITDWRTSNTFCLLISRRQLILYELLLFTILCGSYILSTNTINPRAAHRSQNVMG